MKKLILFIFLAMLGSCDDEPSINDVFSDFKASAQQLPADGQSTVLLSVELNEEASTDRRKVIFKTSSGTFTASGTSSVTVDAKHENGKLIAKATLKASTKPGQVSVSVQPEFDDPNKEFVLDQDLMFVVSSPSSFIIEPSGYGISGNFLTEVKITGILRNSEGNFVSAGNTVRFEDILIDGTPANGKFRDLQLITGDSSKVKCIYSAPSYPIGTQIRLVGTVNNSILRDSIILTINQ